MGIAITGVGSYVPDNIVSNQKLSQIVETNNEWIVERTGIKERRISTGEDTSEMAANAAKLALDMAKVSAEEIDLIIVATITPDKFTPSCGCIVQKHLGAINATAFDINAACSGFVFGIQVAESLMRVHGYKHSLVIGAETLSKAIDWNDRSTCVLFGDGAGAAVLSKSGDEGIVTSFSKAIGEKGDSLKVDALAVKNPYTAIVENPKQYITMDGGEVFKFATGVIVESVNRLLENANLTIDDIDYIVPHGANIRIIQFAAKKLKISIDKFYINLDKFGNTSSASIPLALDEMVKNNIVKNGQRLIFVGFGGGLTFGGSLVNWIL